MLEIKGLTLCFLNDNIDWFLFSTVVSSQRAYEEVTKTLDYSSAVTVF